MGFDVRQPLSKVVCGLDFTLFQIIVAVVNVVLKGVDQVVEVDLQVPGKFGAIPSEVVGLQCFETVVLVVDVFIDGIRVLGLSAQLLVGENVLYLRADILMTLEERAIDCQHRDLVENLGHRDVSREADKVGLKQKLKT